MKKSMYILAAIIFIGQSAWAQPVSDRAVIPVAVSLNQVLRLHVTNGGNVEFVFNTIAQYRNGIANSIFYDTDFEVASSTKWELIMGAEDATLMGTDLVGNTIALNNVGYSISYTGVGATCCLAANDISDPTGATGPATVVNGLAQYLPPAPVILTSGVLENAGDVAENSFLINWVCGTLAGAGATIMNPVSLLNQSIPPDRYVTNVLLDINAIIP